MNVSMFVNILLRLCSMIACETEVRPRGGGGSSIIRYVTQGVELKRYVSLHRGRGVKKIPKLALRNF